MSEQSSFVLIRIPAAPAAAEGTRFLTFLTPRMRELYKAPGRRDSGYKPHAARVRNGNLQARS